MKTFVLIVLAAVLLWDPAWRLFGVRQMFPWELARMLEAPADERPVLLDVRTKTEYRAFHIPGAVNRPASRLFAEHVTDFSGDRPVVVVCMSGHRSPLVVKWLQRAAPGVQTYNLTWGMIGWFFSRGATVGGDSQ